MTQASISNFKMRLGDAASPESFNDIEEVLDISGFGVNNELVEVTNFDSAGAKEFINGLKDGTEVELECNYISGATYQTALKTAVDNRQTRNFQLAYTGASPDETFNFAGVCLAWNIDPSATEQNRINFTIKVTGNIT